MRRSHGAACAKLLGKPLRYRLRSPNPNNSVCGAIFADDQIRRNDLYLGKEPVLNQLTLRFGNLRRELLWRGKWVKHPDCGLRRLGVEARGDSRWSKGSL